MSKYPKLDHRKSGGGTSVEEYGAIGDGKRDQTQYLQQALDRFQHVYVPAGTYLVDGSLTASLDKQVIEGAGKGTVIKMMANKTYDLTQQHAALTMNAGEQTVQDLQLIGPDTGDDSNFSGSGSDWYNLSALRINGVLSTVNGLQVGRCEGVGVTASGFRSFFSLCAVERTGLDGLRVAAPQQSILDTKVDACGKTTYSNITTYPSSDTAAVNVSQKNCVVSQCFLGDNTTNIICTGFNHIISNNMAYYGVHVAATGTIVSNNIVRANSGGNALTVANDGNSFISSLIGNDINPMDQGGANDIIARSSYGQKPVLNAMANRSAEIDRIYQQKAYAEIRPDDGASNSDGSVPFNNIHQAQLINVDASNDTFTVAREMLVQINMPIILANASFGLGQFHVRDADSDSMVTRVYTHTCNNSTSSQLFQLPAALQARLQPNTNYKLHLYSDGNQTTADLQHEDNITITITDLE